MNKLLIGSMIISLMIFTTGFAIAAKPPTPFEFTSTEGFLYIVDKDGDVTADDASNDDIPTISISQAFSAANNVVTALFNLYYGTLHITLPNGTAPTSFEFTGTLGTDNLYHFTGTDGGGNTVLFGGEIASLKDPSTGKKGQAIQLVGNIVIQSIKTAGSTVELAAATLGFSGTLFVQ